MEYGSPRIPIPMPSLKDATCFQRGIARSDTYCGIAL
jgi:hypothetical protein